jgi:hypothetical protein
VIKANRLIIIKYLYSLSPKIKKAAEAAFFGKALLKHMSHTDLDCVD